METEPEFLVAKERNVSCIVNWNGYSNTLPVLGLQPCKSKELNWPFSLFLADFSYCKAGLPQRHGLPETLL